MPDLKTIDVDSVISSLKSCIDFCERELKAAANRAIEDVLLAARALKDLPKATDPLFSRAHAVVVEDFVFEKNFRIRNLVAEVAEEGGYVRQQHIDGRWGAQQTGSLIPKGKVRFLLFVLPVDE